MREPFYRDRLRAGGLVPLFPDPGDQDTIHRILVEELVKGERPEASREAFRQVMERLAQRGAEGIILGCTEIPLLVQPEDARLPLIDTAVLHARAALEWALAEAAPAPWNPGAREDRP
jgi:aspartate racemase